MALFTNGEETWWVTFHEYASKQAQVRSSILLLHGQAITFAILWFYITYTESSQVLLQ